MTLHISYFSDVLCIWAYVAEARVEEAAYKVPDDWWIEFGDSRIDELVREAIIGPIPDGTTEIQKLIVARSLTGIQAFR